MVNYPSFDNQGLAPTVKEVLGNSRTIFTVQGGAEILLNTVELINDGLFVVESGSQIITGELQSGQYSSDLFNLGGVIMNADGAESLLDLSAITNFNADFDSGFSSQQVQTVQATICRPSSNKMNNCRHC